MALRYHPLRFVQRLDLGAALDPGATTGDDLHLIHATGRGSKLELPAGWIALWLPLRGQVQLETAASQWALPSRQLLTTRECVLHGTSPASAWWLVLAGPAAAWNRHWPASREPHQAADLLPRQGPCPRALARLFVRVARCAREGADADTAQATLDALGAALFEHQRDLQPLLDRCNGRTAQRRHQTLLRLLRVRQLIERDREGRLEVAQLAQIANYSPWHLIRMYRDVFGETPSEYAARLRLDRAWQLVRDSGLPVCEITEALGFESQSAFCRAFKNAYGLTTTQARHLPAVARASLRPRARMPQAQTA